VELEVTSARCRMILPLTLPFCMYVCEMELSFSEHEVFKDDVYIFGELLHILNFRMAKGAGEGRVLAKK
ncbi:hypothetical protein LOAG_15901, partial [Loa loa]